jgi:hypothetical protein
MATYCPNCAAEVEPDAKFCGSCRGSLSISTALRNEAIRGLRSLAGDPTMAVPSSVIATIWEVFTILGALVNGAIFYGAISVLGITARFGNAFGANNTGMLEPTLWIYGALLTCAASISAGAVVAYGLLTSKGWSYALYFWYKTALIAVCVVLLISRPVALGGGGPLQYGLFFAYAVFQVYLILSLKRESHAANPIA